MIRTLIIMTALCTALFSQSGGTLDIFEYGPSARSLSLGGSGTALADDASTLFYNPAGLGVLGRQEIIASYNPLYQDTFYGYTGYIFPTVDFGTIGAGLFSLVVPFTGFDANTIGTGTLNFLKFKALIGYGIQVPFFRMLSVGTVFKVDIIAIGASAATTFNMDIGALFALDEFKRGGNGMPSSLRWQLGLNLHNLVITTARKLDTGQEEDIFGVRAGGLIEIPLVQQLWLRVPVDIAYDIPDLFTVSGGIEMIIFSHFTARAGYQLYHGDHIFGAGAGVNFFDIKLDYAISVRPIGMSHNFSLSWTFGESRDDQLRARERSLATRISNEIKTAVDEKDRIYADERAAKEKETSEQLAKIRSAADAEISSLSNTMHTLQSNAIAQMDAVNRNYQKRMEQMLRSNEMLTATLTNALTESDRRMSQIRSNAMAQVDELTRQNTEQIAAITSSNETVKKQLEDRIVTVEKNREKLIKEYSDAVDLYTKGDLEAALEMFRKLRAIDPKNEDIIRYIGIIEGEFRDVNAYTDEIKNLYKEGMRLYVKKEYKEAIAVWKKILVRDPYNKLALKGIERAEKVMNIVEKGTK
ncbi:MAG: hypothetical protein AABZ39_17200 [Spirochaetota bacterium]